MRIRFLSRFAVLTATFVLTSVAFIFESGAKPGGRYKTTAKMLVFNGMTWGPNTPLILRLPNGKGSFRGSFKGSRAGAVGLMGNTPIVGRIRNARSAQGGKKYILNGTWTWKLSQNLLSGNARGNVRFVIKALGGNNYSLKAPIKVRHNGILPYLITGKVR